MPRPCKKRCCQTFNGVRAFKPRGIPMTELTVISLELSELEVMRLCDVEHLDQTEAGLKIGLSRGSVQRLLKRGRAKVVRALIDGTALVIEPGEHDSVSERSIRK